MSTSKSKNNASVIEPKADILLFGPKGYSLSTISNPEGKPWDYNGKQVYLYKIDDATKEPVHFEPEPDIVWSPFSLYRLIYSWWPLEKKIFPKRGGLMDKVRIGLLGGIMLGMAFLVIMAGGSFVGGGG